MSRASVTWSEDDYAPFDQHKHLGEPPWSGPELEAWEEAHGHDARLKCYPEFRCQAIEYESDRLRAEVERLRKALSYIHDWAALGGEWGEQPDARIMLQAHRTLTDPDYDPSEMH